MPKIDIIYEKTDQTQTFTQLMTDPEQQQRITTEDDEYFKMSHNANTI